MLNEKEMTNVHILTLKSREYFNFQYNKKIKNYLTGSEFTTGIFRSVVPTFEIPFSSDLVGNNRILFDVEGVKSEVEEFLPEPLTFEF